MILMKKRFLYYLTIIGFYNFKEKIPMIILLLTILVYIDLDI